MTETTEAAAADGRQGSWRRPVFGIAGTLLAGTILSGCITQYIAAHLTPQPDGFSVGGIYLPWAWIGWSQEPWAAGARSLFGRGYAAMGLTVAALFVAGLLAAARHRRPRRYSDVYGTARFATPKDMAASGFLDQPEGVYIGGWTDPAGNLRYLRHDGAEHIAALAPTRSGKGVGLVLPTLLTYLHSCLIHDEKGELWQLTAGWRSQIANNVVLRWQPGSPDASCKFNFLDTVRLGTPYEVSDAQGIALMVVDQSGAGLKDHWDRTSYALITGVILHKMYQAKAKGLTASLPDVAEALSDPSRSADALYKEMVENQHLGRGKPQMIVAQEGRAQLNREAKERTSVHSAAVTAMEPFKNPIVAGNSRVSDFLPSDLMNHDRPVSLYIVTPGPDKALYRPLVRLLLTTIVRCLTNVTITYENGRPKLPHKRPLLLMLDEFPSLKRMAIIEDSMPTIAGYGIKAYLIMQDREQVLAAYGKNETIFANCHVQIAYAPNRLETAQWIAGILGKRTVNLDDYSESHKQGGGGGNVSHAIRQVSQDLMSPEQVMSLKGPTKKGNEITEPGEMVVWAAGMKARIRGTQILYFRDPDLRRRSLIPPPVNKATIRNVETEAFAL